MLWIFCRRLSYLPAEKQAGRVYRLPTEAEWEYACRGGANSHHLSLFGDSLSSTQANFNGNYPYGGAAKGPYLSHVCRSAPTSPTLTDCTTCTATSGSGAPIGMAGTITRSRRWTIRGPTKAPDG